MGRPVTRVTVFPPRPVLVRLTRTMPSFGGGDCAAGCRPTRGGSLVMRPESLEYTRVARSDVFGVISDTYPTGVRLSSAIRREYAC